MTFDPEAAQFAVDHPDILYSSGEFRRFLKGALERLPNGTSFPDRIRAMNAMYGLPINDTPTKLEMSRLYGFRHTLANELSEITDVMDAHAQADPLECLVELADLLGDIIVYCRSEALKWGIPLEEVLDAIMDSNESKLGPDGKPIFDAHGKFLKGPGYVPPEAKIRELLLVKIALAAEAGK